MRTLIKINIAVTLICCYSLNSYGQATSAGLSNLPLATTDYLGWAAFVNLSLDIKNYDAMPISFYTKAGSNP
jgi:hypothetical protein